MPIAKVTVGKSAYGCLNYVLTKDKAELLDTNCAGDTPAALTQEFEVAFQPHDRNGAKRHTENYVAHFSISFHTQLPRPQLEAIAHRFMGLMGFDPVMNQYVLAQHHDTDDCHIHLVANRIRLDGQVVSDKFQQRRTEVAMRTLEVEFDLPRLKNSWEVDVRAPKVSEVRQSRKSGKPIPRRVLQETIERCVVSSRTLEDLQQQLQQSGVTLTATPREDGNWALLYQLALEGEKVRTFSATKLGKRYTKRGLVSTFGLSFESEGVTAANLETTAGGLPVLPVLPVSAAVVEPQVEPVGKPVGEPEVRVKNANPQAEPLRIEPRTVSVDFQSVVGVPLEGVDPTLDRAVFTPLESQVETGTVHPETPVAPVTSEGFGQEANGSNAQSEGLRIETGNVSNSVEPAAAPQPEPEQQADRFRQQLEQLAAQLAATPATEWTDDLTPTQVAVRAESLNAVVQWTQNHIETLELRALWIGLENASDQTRWETLADQAQQRGLRDPQQIETAVAALACQQGQTDRAIVGLLQQSPRVQAALQAHSVKQVQQTLQRNVAQVREALQRQEQEARRIKTER